MRAVSLVILMVLLGSMIPPNTNLFTPALAQNTPDLEMTGAYYKVQNNGVRVFTTVENLGGKAGHFNVTFDFIAPQSAPEVREIPFRWVNASEVDNVTKVSSGAYLRGGSAILKDDDGYLIYELPFELNFFGIPIKNISVSTNGYIELMAGHEESVSEGDYGVWDLLTRERRDFIAGLDDDLETDDGYLLIAELKDGVLVEWFGSSYEDYDSENYPVNFQILILSNGTIVWSYRLLRASTISGKAGYFSRVALESSEMIPEEGKSYSVNVPSLTPTSVKIPVSGLGRGEAINLSVESPVPEGYVRITADEEGITGDSDYSNNFAELWLWPGDYWIENASIEEVIPGEPVEINFTVKTTSEHPGGVRIKLLRNGEVEAVRFLSDFSNGTLNGTLSWLAQGGNYTLSLGIDAMGDTNESNNAFILGSYSFPLPNFRVASYSIRIPNCLGDFAEIAINVTNDGDINWSDVDVRASLIYDDNRSSSDWAIIPFLPAGGTFEVVLSPDVLTGNITGVLIEVDPYDAIDEFNETDNLVEVPRAMSITPPDFAVTGMNVPERVTSGNLYLVNVTVENLGGCYARDVRVNLYEEGEYEDSAYVKVNGTTRVSLSWKPSKVGWVNLTALVDPHNRVPESDEDNNGLTVRTFVSGPDLVITNVTLLTFDGIAGSPAKFNVTVKNLGEGFTRGFSVGVYGGIYHETRYIPGGLESGEERTLTVTTYANGGNVSLRFVVDDYNAIPETNESNNELSYTLNVPVPNFIVESISLPENSVGQVPVNVTVKNTGAPYNASWYGVNIRLETNGSYEYFHINDLFAANETRTLSGRIKLQAPGALLNATISSKVNETSKTDNWLAVNATTGYPDLITEIEVPNVSAGDYAPVTFMILNKGNASLWLGWRGLLLRYGVEYEDNHTAIHNCWIGDLRIEPGENVSRTFELAFNGGKNRVFAYVDPFNWWVEGNESNNWNYLVVSVEKPDFVVSGYSVPDEVLNGTAYLWKNYPIKVNVTNLGGNFSGRLYIDLYDNGSYVDYSYLSGLPKGETREVILHYRPEPGEHNLTISLDPDDRWIETDESNNNLTLGNLSFSLPELVLLGVTWEPYNFTSGERVTFKAYVRNTGQPFYRPFSLRFEIWNGSEKLTYGYGYPYNAGWEFDNKTREFRWTWYNAKPGNLTLRVFVDYSDVIPELKEDNNNLTINLGSVGTPDFEVDNLSVGKLAYGKFADINVTIRNLGEAIYRPFSVLFNISGELHYVKIYGMTAGEERTVTYRWYVDRIENVEISVKADPGDLIVEANETNNEVSGDYFVKAPELRIESYKLLKDDLSRGYVTFRVNVTNSGGDTYTGFYLAMYVDGIRRARVWIPELLSGRSSEKTLGWRIESGGRHEVILVVDDGDRIPESNEANNAVETNVTVELPDIEMGSISIPEMHANGFFNINVTLRNPGTEDVERPFLVAVFQDDKYLGGKYVTSLPAGSSFELEIPVRPYPGDSVLKVVADYHNSVVETNETNNELSVGIHVRAPDIRVVSFIPGRPGYSGEKVNATVVVRNVGDYESGTFYVALRHDGKTLGGRYAENLPPGEERNINITWKADAGRYNLTAFADPYGNVREWNEENNAISVEVSVPAPDLKIIGFEHSNATAGEDMSFTVVIENVGEKTLLPFYVGIYANSSPIAVKRVYGLSSGERITLNFENAWRARYGKYKLKAVVDVNDEVSELNENNNAAEVSAFIPDERAPMLVRTYPGNGSFTNEPSIGAVLIDEGSGIDYARSELRVYLNGSQVEGSTGLSWGWLVFRNSTPLTDGNYTVVLRAIDKAGNSKEYRWGFVLDRKAPKIETNAVNGSLYNGSFRPEVNVTDENLKGYLVKINGRNYRGEAIKTDGSYLLEVIAFDKAGNEARYSAWFEVNGIPHPPSGLLINVSNAYVELNWLPSGDSDIAGYYVYRDGVRLNEEPVETTTFRDAFTGSMNYSVTAVDYMGFESEPARVFPARLTITAGKAYVGYPLKVSVEIENLGGHSNGSLSLQLVDVFGDVVRELRKRVELSRGTTRENFEVTVPSGLTSLRAVLVVDNSSTQTVLPLNPVKAEKPKVSVGKLYRGLPGLVEVRIKNHGSAPLDTSRGLLLLENVSGEPIEPLPKIKPGEEAVLRYRVVPEERGSHTLIFRLGDLMVKREVEVIDPVTNPLMVLTESLVRGEKGKVHVTFRNTGSAPLRVRGIEAMNMRKDVDVLLPPNLSVEVSFDYTVPANASKVIIKAVAYTDIGTFERTVTVDTEEPPYNANVTVKPVFIVGEAVEIEGFAYNESGLLANVPVKVSIVRGDFVREYLVVTDSSGNFRMIFSPFRNEAGHFVVSATHPSVTVPERDAEFDIVGLTLVPNVYKLTVTKEFNGTIEVRVVNHWKASNVTVDVSAPAGYSVSIPSRIELKSGVNRVRIGLSSKDASNGTVVITFRTVQLGIEVERNLTVSVEVLPAAPRIVTEPRSIQAGILTNETRSVSLRIRNTGFEELKNVSVSSSIDWVRIVSNFTELGPGEDASIGLYIVPPANATGTFEGTLKIDSSNYRDVYVPMRITVTPNATGSLRVTVMDPNATRLEGAEVTLYNGYAHFEGTADKNGTVVFRNVPVGDYTLIVGEESHYTSERMLTIEPGVEGNVTIVLMPSVLKIEWEVVPVTIQDVYVIKHEIGYTTYVPAPEIETYGGNLEVYIDYEKLAELGVVEFRGQLVVRNTHRYVSVFNVTFESGGSHYIDVEFLVDRIDELKPGETVVVPYVIRVYHHRSPPMNPCLHETKVFTLKAGVICVEEAGKITLRAGKVHKIIVKPTCEGCWKSLFNILAQVGFEALGEKVGELLKNDEIAKDAGENIVKEMKELYDAYYQLMMNPTAESMNNYDKTFKKVKGNIVSILKNATIKYGEEYIGSYLEAEGLQLSLITDEKGNPTGVVSSLPNGIVYPKIMSVVNLQNGSVQIDWEKAFNVANDLSGGAVNELKDLAENLPAVKVLNLMVKIVDDYTPLVAEAGLNCAICLLRNNCTPPSPSDLRPIQLVRSDYFLGYTGGEAGTGGGGGEASIGRFTCEGLPKPKNPSTTRNPQSMACSSCSQSPGLSREKKVCVNVPLEKSTQLPARGDGPSNTLHMCVDLVITIEQRLTFERQAFRASLRFTNTNANYSLEDVNVTLLFLNQDAEDSTNRFFVRPEESSGLVNGDLPPGREAELRWLIIPKVGAAERFRTRYYVMANITARVGETILTFETWPAVIEVEPVPQLELDYVIPRKVYGDDPYTPEVEPPVPFFLGVRVKNTGYGIARNLRIASAQPRIERSNQPGIHIGFRIIGTLVNGRKVPNDLTVDFGDLKPGESSTAAWIMASEVTGDFVYYNATFRHSDELGGEKTSLIKALRTHFLFRAFNDTVMDDGMLDFLIDDDGDGLPEMILDSDGDDYGVLAINFTEEHEKGFRKIIPLVKSPGWVYLKVNVGGYTRALRSDGKNPVVQWVENRTLHILDFGTPEFYALRTNRPPVPVITLRGKPIVNGTVTLDASLSYDPDGRIVNYLWTIGNESFEGALVNYTFGKQGNHTVALTVWDNENLSATVMENITVYLGPEWKVIVTASPERGVVPFNVTVSANVTNSGDTSGVFNATLVVDGEDIEWKAGAVEPGSWRLFNFTVELDEPGMHTLGVNDVEVNVTAYRNVTVKRLETLDLSRDFGHYQSLSWGAFRADFENWSRRVLEGVEVNTSDFEELLNVSVGNWSLLDRSENLELTSPTGWINATYERNATVVGVAGLNYTTLLLTQRVTLFANASHRIDREKPLITLETGSGIYTEVPSINVTVIDETNVTVWGTAGNESRNFTEVETNGNVTRWTGVLPLEKGNNTVTIYAKDSFGNLANATLWVYLNTEKPMIFIESPREEVYNEKLLWINYTVTDDDIVGVRAYLDGNLISEEPKLSTRMTLDYGTHNLTVTAWDVSYNVSRSVIFRINEPPKVNFTWKADHLVVRFASNASDPDGIVRYLWNFGDGETSAEMNPVHVYPKGGVYRVSLTVWDGLGLNTTVVNEIEVFANVSIVKNESRSLTRYFGFYNTTSWEPFRRDFGAWVNSTLRGITINTSAFDTVEEMTTGNWSEVIKKESLEAGSEVGWINATYERRVLIRGNIDHNDTTLLLTQRVTLFANASHVPDDRPPVIVILYPENETYDHNVTLVEVNVTDESEVAWVVAELDGRSFNLKETNGTWRASVNVGDGEHVLTVRASDVWGNVGNASLTFTVNTSVRVVRGNNTTVIIVPGEKETKVSIENGSLRVEVALDGTSFVLPAGGRFIIDEHLRERPWLFVARNTSITRIKVCRDRRTEGTNVYDVLKYTLNVSTDGNGLGVLAIPLKGMTVRHVTLFKTGKRIELTEKVTATGYIRISGRYLYVAILGDPVVEVTLERLNGEETSARTLALWMNLGLHWKNAYLHLSVHFNELLRNVTNFSDTNRTTIRMALEKHGKARKFYRRALTYNPYLKPVMYAVCMRKAYLLEREAVELLAESII